MAAPSRAVAISAYVASGFIWGTAFLFMRWSGEHISPSQTSLLRMVFGVLPIAVFALWGRHVRLAHLRHVHHFLVLSVLAASFYYYAFAVGAELLDTSIAGALTGTIPLITAVVAAAALPDERLTRGGAVGLAAGLIGVVLLAEPWTSSSADPAGVAWMLIGCLSIGLSFVYTRRFITPLGVHPAASATYQLTFGALIALPLTDLHGITALADDPKALWGVILGLGMAATGFAFVLYYVTIAGLGAAVGSTASYIPPAVSMVLGVLILHEPLRVYGVLGLLLIGVGAIVSHRSAPRGPARTLEA